MRHYQEYKIVSKTPDGRISECFFFEHSFKTAYQHALHYIEHNTGKRDTELFQIHEGVGARWRKVDI